MKKLINLLFISLITLSVFGQDSKISDLSSASQPLNDADLFVVVQSATTKKYTFDNLQYDIFTSTYAVKGSATDDESIFLGYLSGTSYSAGNGNYGIGSYVFSGGLNSGTRNNAFGYHALKKITTGDYNNAFGDISLSNGIVTGSYNCGFGRATLYDLTSGSYNVAISASALENLTTGSNNIGIGNEAGYTISTGSNLLAIGYQAGKDATVAGTFIGYTAGTDVSNGANNVALGSQSLYVNTIGAGNTCIGTLAGRNTAGSNNTILGYNAGYNTSGKDSCVLIGYNAGYNVAVDNSLVIENTTTTTDMLIFGDFSGDEVIIDGQASDNTISRNFYVDGTAGGDGAWNNDSDSTLKKDIETIPDALEKVMGLRGVTFAWKDGREDKRRMGFIAQEAQEFIPEAVDGVEGGMSIQYAPVVALLTEAIQEQQRQIIDLQYYLKAMFSILAIMLIGFIILFIKWRKRSGKILLERGESSS